jgi:hypothetical protein
MNEEEAQRRKREYRIYEVAVTTSPVPLAVVRVLAALWDFARALELNVEGYVEYGHMGDLNADQLRYPATLGDLATRRTKAQDLLAHVYEQYFGAEAATAVRELIRLEQTGQHTRGRREEYQAVQTRLDGLLGGEIHVLGGYVQLNTDRRRQEQIWANLGKPDNSDR